MTTSFNQQRRRAMAILGGSPALLSLSAFAAQSASRIICTAPPGSIPDIIARRYAEAFSSLQGLTSVVENKPGAAGQVAIASLRQAAPDGQTLLLAQGAVASVYPHLYSKLNYDPQADLVPVSLAAETHMALAVGEAVPTPIQTLSEFLAWLKRNPKEANFASPGVGTLPHLLTALLMREEGQQWQHVTYPGGPQAIVDLLGGRVSGLVLPEGLFRQHVQAGKLRLLATSGQVRSVFNPQVPSFHELGYKSLVMQEWFAFFAPRATSNQAVQQASKLVVQAASEAGVKRNLAELAMQASASTPRVMQDKIRQEGLVWQEVLRQTGIKAE